MRVIVFYSDYSQRYCHLHIDVWKRLLKETRVSRHNIINGMKQRHNIINGMKQRLVLQIDLCLLESGTPLIFEHRVDSSLTLELRH